MKVVVHIGRLVLDGLDLDLGPGHAPRIGDAVQREITRLLSDAHEASFTSRAVPRIAAPQILPAPGESPETTGSRIATAVHSAIAGIVDAR